MGGSGGLIGIWRALAEQEQSLEGLGPSAPARISPCTRTRGRAGGGGGGRVMCGQQPSGEPRP